MKALVRGVVLLSVASLFVGCASTNEDEQGARLTIRSLIDGADRIMVRGDQIWFEHHAYDLPGQWLGSDEPTYVNKDNEWKPVWNGSLSEKFLIPEKESALPPNRAFTAETLEVSVKGGWGRMDVAEYPSADNDFTLVLSINDCGPDGAHWYEVRIDWDDAAPAK
jgi:hypothetical protein